MTRRRISVAAVGLVAAALVVTLLILGLRAGKSPGVPTPTTPVRPVAAGIVPASLDVPAIDAHSTLIPTGLNPDGTVEVPPLDHPEQASWYRYSPAPGETGPAVILGHINANGTPGVFALLARLRPGDHVEVTRTDGTLVRFTVTRVDTVPKNAFLTQAVYGDTTGPELRLISCGGHLDTSAHSYTSNVIAWARETT